MDNTKENSYKIIANHLFRAHLKYEGDRTLIILADDIEEAKAKAASVFGINSIFVDRLIPTDNPQVYEI